jgi:hypothetical protein
MTHADKVRIIFQTTIGVIDDEINKSFILIGPYGQLVITTIDQDGDHEFIWQECGEA